MRRLRSRTILFAILVIASCSGLVTLGIRAYQHVERGEHVASVPWLPESASNVCYYRSYLFTAYEFDRDEDVFRAWTNEPVQEITEPVRIVRYSQPSYKHEEELLRYELPDEYPSHLIRSGLYYGYLQDNGGGCGRLRPRLGTRLLLYDAEVDTPHGRFTWIGYAAKTTCSPSSVHLPSCRSAQRCGRSR